MSKLKSLTARIWKLPFWVFLLPAFIMLGWSHFKEAENERIKQRWTTRIEVVETKFESTDALLEEHKEKASRLEKKVVAAKARGGATDAQKQAFRVEMARLKSQLALINEQSEQSEQARKMLDKLQKDKDAGLFDER